MATSTFLTLINKVLRKINELPLTASTFSTATGFHAFVKDAVNNSVREINRESFEWPFNQKEGTQVLVPNQTFYAYPADAKILDLDTFRLTYTRGGENNYSTLRHVDYDTYVRIQYSHDQHLMSNNDARVPNWVFKHGDQFGIAQLPSNADTVNFTYWGWSDELLLDTDLVNIPDRYDDVIIMGAVRECYDFRSMTNQAASYDGKFKDGIKGMRTQLLNDYIQIHDTRVGF